MYRDSSGKYMPVFAPLSLRVHVNLIQWALYGNVLNFGGHDPWETPQLTIQEQGKMTVTVLQQLFA